MSNEPGFNRAAIALDESQPIKIIQVAANTVAKGLAGSVAEEFRQAHPMLPNLSLHAIGHGAVGQAVKAVTIANTLLISKGVLVTVLPSFEDKEMADESNPGVAVNRTVMRMRLIPWSVGG